MAGELLANLGDVNTHLAMVHALTDSIDDQLQVDAQRVIRSQLSGVFQPATLYSWDVPANTPAIIRRIAGELIAAKYYAETYSENSTAVPDYAMWLYNEAIAQLAAIKAGTLIVTDDDGNPLTDNADVMSALDFWPNDTTAGPYFTMDKEWA